MGLVKFTLAMTIFTIIVALSMLIGIAVTYPSTTPEGEIGGVGEEITPPAIDIELSMAVIPDADGKVPEGGVSASDDKATVEIPAGVQLEEGAESLTFTATSMETTADISKTTPDELIYSVDLHVAGVAKDNTVPMSFALKEFLPKGLNDNNVRLFHVENGETIEMTLTTTPAAHNEFSYDPLTGDAVITIASFSEVVVAADESAPWNGETFDYTWYKADGDLTIANANQFAAFRNIVDGGYYDKSTDTWTWKEVTQDSFEGQKITLGANINLAGNLFDPIGWGYVNTSWNSGGALGKVFQGTFDGNGKTIFGLSQSGWDLKNVVTGEAYTYTNCGFGLFAAASNATFKNLTISGARIRVECVEAGVLVGLSQNKCTYENIKILDSKIANYQRPAGGLIGEVSGEGKTTITNVIIAGDVVVGSLWGDFDAPVGGVIGAYWNDAGKNPEIYMTNLDVGCRLDVYNDITSAYQWHAYRRAGMLIGNTDMSDPNNAHKAYAPFLKCENVKVYYGDWVDYTYCSFSNHNSRYPWVRTQVGENCEAFSNPRWGVPNDMDGNRVTDMNHVHQEGDECNVLRQFSQLYGGGQGVYGQDTHEGVTYPEKAYSITYVNDGKTLDVIYVTDNTKDFTIKGSSDQAYKLVVEWAEKNLGKIDEDFVYNDKWMNAGSTTIDKVDAGNTDNIVLYPQFDKPYTAIFVDPLGNVVAWTLFHDGEGGLDGLEDARKAAEAALPDLGDGFKFDYWEVHITNEKGEVTDKPTYNENSFAGYDQNVTIYPVYKYEGDVKLIPVDTDNDGIINYYQVAGYSNPNGQDLVEIPGSVNGIPVTGISGGAFSSYDGVHSIIVPAEVTYIGDNAFAKKWGLIDSGETITIYYGGSYADWLENEPGFASNWESGISSSTRIFFLNGGDKVDVTQGYLKAEVKSSWGKRTVSWNHNATISSSIINEYYGACDCDACDGADRPDKAYWEGVTAN